MRLASYLIFTFTLITACSNDYKIEDYSKIENERSDLVLGLVSYMDSDEAKKNLQFDDDKIIVVEDSRSPKREDIPPFDFLTIKFLDIQMDNFKGALTLTFFNERLMEARFYPANVEVFAKNIKGLTHSSSVNIEPYTKIWLAKNYQGVSYIGWTDIRLEQQLYAWIKNYS